MGSESGPVLGSDGNLYIGSAAGLMSLTPDGSVRWNTSLTYAGDDTYCTPAIAADGTVYVGRLYGERFYAVNPDGTVKWEYALRHSGRVLSSPVIGPQGSVYFAACDGYVYALNPDGSLKWERNTNQPFHTNYFVASPALSNDGTLYIGVDGGPSFFALDASNGTEKWNFNYRGRSSPAIGNDGTIYVGTDDDKVWAINPDGTSKWSFYGGEDFFSSPAIAPDGTIVIGCTNRHLYAINPDGTLKWDYYDQNCEINGSPMIDAAGNIYVQGSKFRSFTPDGLLRWEIAEGWGGVSQPILGADGVLYVNISGDLVSIVPEPATLSLLAVGALALIRRRRK